MGVSIRMLCAVVFVLASCARNAAVDPGDDLDDAMAPPCFDPSTDASGYIEATERAPATDDEAALSVVVWLALAEHVRTGDYPEILTPDVMAAARAMSARRAFLWEGCVAPSPRIADREWDCSANCWGHAAGALGRGAIVALPEATLSYVRTLDGAGASYQALLAAVRAGGTLNDVLGVARSLSNGGQSWLDAFSNGVAAAGVFEEVAAALNVAATSPVVSAAIAIASASIVVYKVLDPAAEILADCLGSQVGCCPAGQHESACGCIDDALSCCEFTGGAPEAIPVGAPCCATAGRCEAGEYYQPAVGLAPGQCCIMKDPNQWNCVRPYVRVLNANPTGAVRDHQCNLAPTNFQICVTEDYRWCQGLDGAPPA